MRNEELRIAIKSFRREHETNEELVKRVVDNERLINRLVNMCPSITYNINMIKKIILSDSFIESLD